MFYGLINLTWFDLITVGFTFTTLIAIQVINALWHIKVDSDKNVLSDSDDKVTKSLNINDFKSVTATTTASESTATSSTPATQTIFDTITANAAAAASSALTNGKLQKQQSEQSEKYVSN